MKGDGEFMESMSRKRGLRFEFRRKSHEWIDSDANLMSSFQYLRYTLLTLRSDITTIPQID